MQTVLNVSNSLHLPLLKLSLTPTFLSSPLLIYVYGYRFRNRNFMYKSGRNKRRARTQEYFCKLLCVECKCKENHLLHYIVNTELGLQVHNINPPYRNQKTYFLLIIVIQLQIYLGGTMVLVRFTKGLQKRFSLYIFSS